MRRTLAAFLLVVQLQPLAGSVLCLASVHPASAEHPLGGMAGMDGMNETAPASRPIGSVLDRPGASSSLPGCPLINACAPSVNAVLASAAAHATPDAARSVVTPAAGPILTLDSRAPPTPPPNS
jgi:hypothetical protein